MGDRQGEQVQVCHLLVTLPAVGIKEPRIGDGQVIWPECVATVLLRSFELGEHLGWSLGAGVARMSEHPQTTVLCQRTGSPTMGKVRVEPILGREVCDVSGIE